MVKRNKLQITKMFIVIRKRLYLLQEKLKKLRILGFMKAKKQLTIEEYQQIVIKGLVYIITFYLIVFAYSVIKPFLNAGSFWNFTVWLKGNDAKIYIFIYFLSLLVFIYTLVKSFLKESKIQLRLPLISKVSTPLFFSKLRFVAFSILHKLVPTNSHVVKLAGKKKRITYSLLLLLTLLPLVAFTLVNIHETKAAWWSDSWLYRKKINLANTGSAQTDFQVLITVDTASLISVGKMQADCDDLRILDSQSNLLNYWIEPVTNACNSATTDIWVKVPSISTSGESLYLYYGNSWAPSLASGENTFIYYQDFSGLSDGTDITAVSGWTKDVADGSTYTIESNKLKMYHPGSVPSEARDGAIYTHTSELTSDTAVDADVTVANSDNWDFMLLVHDTTGTHSDANSTAVYTAITNETWRGYGGGGWTDIQSALTIGTTYRLSAGMLLASDTYKTYLNGTYKIDKTFPDAGTTGIAKLFFGNYGYSTIDSTWYVDNIRLRKFSTTISNSLSPAEEQSPGTAVGDWQFDEGYSENSINPINKNEQQLNFTNREYITTSSTYVPTDNSLGIVHWDADKYTGATVYFEAVVHKTGGSAGDTISVALHTTSGSLVSDSVKTTYSTTYTRLRSGALSLTDDTDYSVRISDTCFYGCTAYLKAARLIIIQSDSDKITDTETVIDLGTPEKQTSSTSTQLTNKKIYYYDQSKFTPTPSTYFEADLRNSQPTIEQQINILDKEYITTSQSYAPTDNSLGIIHWDADKYSGATVYFEMVAHKSGGTGSSTVCASLFTTGGSQVASSDITTTSDSYTRVRSGAVTLTDDTDYTVRIEDCGFYAATSYINAARLIIIQSDATKITGTQTQIEIGAQEKVGSNSATELTNKKIYYYDSTKFTPSPTAYFEASLRNSQPTIEQQINIVNRSYSSNSTTYVPADNSLGIIRWDADKYSNATVYLETVMYKTGGLGSSTVCAALFTTGGAQVSGSEMTVTSGSYVRTRSGPISLTDDTDYSVRVRDCGSYELYAYIKSARLIVIQSDATKITNTDTQIEVGDYQTAYTNTDYADLTNFKIFQYDQGAFSPTPESTGDVEFHASLQVADLADTVYAELYNKTDSFPVAELSHTGDVNWTLKRATNVDSDADWDTTNDDEYIVRVKCVDGNDGSCSGSISNAKITISQADTNGITKLQTYRQMINTLKTDADATYTSQDYLNYYNPDLLTSARSFAGGEFTYYMEATMKTSAGTGYARSYNATDAAAITNGEISTTGTSYTRVRSAEITSNLPQFPQHSGKNLDTQLKNSATNTTSVSSSWVIVQINNLATNGVTTYAELYNATDNLAVTNSEVSTTSTSWTLLRSPSITLTTGKEYILRLRSSINGIYVHITNAKIILDQSDAGGITALEVYQMQVNRVRTDADATYSNTENMTLYNLDLATATRSFAGGEFNYFYESTLKTTAGTAYARLYNTSDAAAISGSEITTPNTGYTRVRSSDITANLPQYPQNGGKNLDTQLKNSATNTTSTSSGWVIIQVSNLATNGVTAYADLYNLTDSTPVANSEVSTTSTGFTRVRSGALSLTTEKEYAVRVKSSINNTAVHTSGARLILDQSDANGIYAVETVQQMVNTRVTDSDSTYTDQDYLNQYNSGNSSFIAPNYNNTEAYFEATIKTSAGTGYATLRNRTDGLTISGAELTTMNTNYERVRTSASIITNLPTSAKNMDTQIKNSATNTTTVSTSWLIIQNNNSLNDIIHDSSVNQRHGTYVGADWKKDIECKSEVCLSFDGTGDHVLVPDNELFDFDPLSSFTITAWFKHAESISGNQVIVSKFENSLVDGGYKIYMDTNGKIVAGIDDDDTGFPDDSVTSPLSYNDGVWHHVAFTKSGIANIKLYIDGDYIGTDNQIAATATLANDDNLYFGLDANGSSNAWEGYLDGIRIYHYERTDSEIKIDFDGGLSVLGTSNIGGLGDDLVTYLAMDEASADTCDGTNDSCDSSGYGNHAAWNDNAASSTGKFGNALSLDGTSDRAILSTVNGVFVPVRRRSITVTNTSGSELTNYQVQMNIDYDFDMQPDFDDLRFTNSSDIQLDYWLESKIDSTSAIVWVEVDTIPANDSASIYMYYGNPSASSASNGNNTFQMFDDFDTDLGYTRVGAGNGNYSVASSVITFTVTSAGGGVDHGYRVGSSFPTVSGTQELRASMQPSILQELHGVNFCANYSDGTYFYKFAGTQSGYGQTPELAYGGSGLQQVRAILNDFTCTGDVSIMHDDDTTPSAQSKYDWMFIRKYLDSEPNVNIGAESALESLKMTMTAWVNPSTLDASQRNIIASGSSPSYNWYVGTSPAEIGKIVYSIDGDTTTTTSTTTLSTNKWYHVVLTIEGVQTKLYIDGVLDSDNKNSGIQPVSGNITVGASQDGTNTWAGKIDEVRIYKRTLDPNEVAQLYKWNPANAAHWEMDEGEGTIIYDKSGNGNVSQNFTGNVTWGNGKYGRGLIFDGDDDVVRITEGSTIDLGATSQSYSIGGWFKTSQNYTSNAVLAAKNDGTGAYPYQLYLNSSEYACFAISDGTASPSVCGSTALNNNQWHHVSGVRDVITDKLYIYVDGVQTNSTADTTTATSANDDNVSIGNGGVSYTANDFKGELDDIRIYNYPLNAEQVVEDMNAGHPAPGSPMGGPVLNWSFDDGHGDTANDSSITGIDGNLAGAATCPGNSACPTWTNEGKFNKALSFDGGDYVNYTGNPTGLSGNFEATFTLWAKPTNVTGGVQTLFGIIPSISATGRSAVIVMNNAGSGSVGFHTQSCGRDTSPGVLANDNWYHIAWVKSSGSVASTTKLFINGKEISTNQFFPDCTPNLTGVKIAAGAGWYNADNFYPFSGIIDDAKIYNFALSPDQILVDMNQGKAQQLGASSTTSTGSPDRSSDREYCVPGDSSTCNAPVAEWRMDEKTGTSAYDTSGSNSVGTLGGDGSGTDLPSWTSAKFSSGLSFDGSDDYVDIGTGPASIKTVEFWVKPKTTTEYFVNITGVTDYIWANAGTVTATGFTSPIVYVNGKPTDTLLAGQWQHVAIVTDTAENASNLDIGRTEDSNYLEGIIDEVRVYDYARSQAQVAWSFNQGAPLAHWDFDECTGNTVHDVAEKADRNSTVYNGTIYPQSQDNNVTGSCNSGVATHMWNDGTNGKYEASIGLDGDDDYVSLPEFPELSNYTVSFWFNSSNNINSSSTYNMLLYNATGTDPDSYIHFNAADAGKIRFDTWNPNGLLLSSKDSWNAGEWYHITLTYKSSSGEVILYINGTSDNSTTVSGLSLNTNSSHTLGTYLNGTERFFDGQMDEIKLFNYALTENQIKTLYNHGAVRFGQ